VGDIIFTAKAGRHFAARSVPMGSPKLQRWAVASPASRKLLTSTFTVAVVPARSFAS
jgi:hypothetical protein